MPSSEPSTLPHTPLSLAPSSVSNENFSALTSPRCSALSPATFPESVFGWPALVLAFQVRVSFHLFLVRVFSTSLKTNLQLPCFLSFCFSLSILVCLGFVPASALPAALCYVTQEHSYLSPVFRNLSLTYVTGYRSHRNLARLFNI